MQCFVLRQWFVRLYREGLWPKRLFGKRYDRIKRFFLMIESNIHRHLFLYSVHPTGPTTTTATCRETTCMNNLAWPMSTYPCLCKSEEPRIWCEKDQYCVKGSCQIDAPVIVPPCPSNGNVFLPSPKETVCYCGKPDTDKMCPKGEACTWSSATTTNNGYGCSLPMSGGGNSGGTNGGGTNGGGTSGSGTSCSETCSQITRPQDSPYKVQGEKVTDCTTGPNSKWCKYVLTGVFEPSLIIHL